MANGNRKVRRRVSTEGSRTEFPLRHSFEAAPVTIPVWWVNSIVAIFLLPVAAIWTQVFFNQFSDVAIHRQFWATEEFWFFFLGVDLWVLAFFGLPRPLLIYVFGHELTHALWVWAMGGRVTTFRVRRDGGHIITDTHNFWIALAPYFFPIYSIFAILVYGAAGLVVDVLPYRQFLFAVLGITWGFHVSFTLWMISKGQTDLTYYGTFFSLVIIYLMNLLVLTILLIVASPHITWIEFGEDLGARAMDFSAWAWARLRVAGS